MVFRAVARSSFSSYEKYKHWLAKNRVYNNYHEHNIVHCIDYLYQRFGIKSAIEYEHVYRDFLYICAYLSNWFHANYKVRNCMLHV